MLKGRNCERPPAEQRIGLELINARAPPLSMRLEATPKTIATRTKIAAARAEGENGNQKRCADNELLNMVRRQCRHDLFGREVTQRDA